MEERGIVFSDGNHRGYSELKAEEIERTQAFRGTLTLSAAPTACKHCPSCNQLSQSVASKVQMK
jgi:hypothetical protein